MKQKESNLHQNEIWGCKPINPKWCMSCRFSHGKPPFEDSPLKSYCMIYSRENHEHKPPEVYYEGAECEYYTKDNNNYDKKD